MPLYNPDASYVAPEWQELAGKITNGDGLGWPGDPRLSLGLGIMEVRENGRKRTGRRLEVWRHNEDGTDTMIAHWHPSEAFKVCFDLAQMRVDSPGHISVEDRIDKHNDALVKKHEDAARESMMETLDHAIRIHHDQNNPRNKFFLGGRDAARA